MDPMNYGLESPRILGMLQPKREMLDHVDPGVGASLPQLQTPKRGETVSAQAAAAGGSAVKASQNSRFSAFTPTHENHHVTHLQTMTPVTTLFTDYSTPKSENNHERSLWADVSLTPETPGRKTMVERTVLADRLSGSSPFCLTPERQPLDFMSPDRDRRDSGRRGRPRADMVNNLIISGAQSGNPIKCKICSRYVAMKTSLCPQIAFIYCNLNSTLPLKSDAKSIF